MGLSTLASPKLFLKCHNKKGSLDILHIFECKKVRSRSALQIMPRLYHSPDSPEFGWPIIPASSVLSNNMGGNTRLSSPLPVLHICLIE